MKSSDLEKSRGSLSFAVDEKRMNRNARASANVVDWKSTKLHKPQGGQLGIDPVRLVIEEVNRQQRQVAFDVVAEMRTDRLHQLLDELIHANDAEPEESNSDSEEPEEESAEFSMDSLLQELAAIADDEPRSVGKDAVQKKKVCCFDCGTLAAKQINEQVRASARLI